MSDEQAECPPKRQERRDARENRQRLLAVAKELFAKQPIDTTSMHEIARAAGVGQGTLYRHFADKGELCHALIKEDIAAFRERVGAQISGPQERVAPLARLEYLLSEKVRLTESHLRLFAAMEDAAAGARRTRSFRGPFHVWLREQIIALLNEAIAIGDVAALDVEFTADIILAAMTPPLYSYQRHELGYRSERIVAGLRRVFIDGLRQPIPVEVE